MALPLTRKQFLSTAAAAPLSALAPQKPAARDARPNVLILMSDQHRWDLLSCAGNTRAPTPNIDRIAQSGVRFTNACCPYPVCVGSRVSFLTGLYAHNHGAVTNDLTLDWRRRTVAHHFQDHGYITALIGKMHLNHPFLHGFNYHLSANDWLMYLGPRVQLYADDIASHQHSDVFFRTVVDHGSCFPEIPDLWRDGSPWAGRVRHNPNVASELEAEHHIDAFVARETSRFLERHKDQPFFLVAGFLKPHPPFHPPKGWAENYPAESARLPPLGDLSGYPQHIRQRVQRLQALGEARLRSGLAGYLGNLAFLDNCIGQVWKTLEDTGLRDNTIVIYTSDHGDMLGDHGLWQKFVLYEPSANVPLIVSYPKAIPAGKVCRALVEYIGIYPTVAEFAGTRTPAHLDARSFAALCRNPDAKGPEARFTEYALAGPVPMYAARTDRYKYIHNDGQIDELYDLEADTGENRNLAGDSAMQKVRRQMKDRLFAWYDPARNPYRPKRA